MKSTYKPIGDFIELVDVRNKVLSVNHLLGLSITKEFIPSVANTVGTNMSNYKIIKKNQFACSLMQVRRDKKMPVALLKDFDEAIISQAYPVFQVIDEEVLSPDYLMMWFSRSEFDRHACFLAVGGVRGSLEWDDFLEMELPVPSIEKQREIVKEYNTIVNRITLNEQLNQKLEETAQALYKHWFVDFEFPNENGQPYKTYGGKMEYDEELDQEIPEGWEVNTLGSEFDISIGRTPPRIETHWFNRGNNGLKWVSIKDLGINGSYILTTEESLTDDAIIKFNVPIIPKNTAILSFKMSVGIVSITTEEMLSNEAIAHIKINDNTKVTTEFIYCYLKNFHFNSLGTTSSIVNSINSTMVKAMKVSIPDSSTLLRFNGKLNSILKHKKNLELQNMKANELLTVLLARISSSKIKHTEQIL